MAKTLTNQNDVAVEIKESDSFYMALKETSKLQGYIDKAKAVMEERKETISGTLFALAKDECANSLKNFLARCENAEDRFKNERKANIPKQWSQAKSNIKAALNIGLTLTDYETESSMRKALTAARKAAKEGAELEQGDDPIDLITSNIKAALIVCVDTGQANEALREVESTLQVLKLMAAAPVFEGEAVEIKEVV